METCLDEGPWDIFPKKSAFRRSNEGCKGHLGTRFQSAEQKNGNDKYKHLPITFEDLFKYYPTCPPDAFVNIKEFYLNSKLNKYDENDKIVRVTLRNWCTIIRDWDIFDFNIYYNTSGVYPYFNAYSR